MNSLACDPMQPWYFAAGSNDSTVRIFDRRMLDSGSNGE